MKSRAKSTKTARPDERLEGATRPRIPNRRGSPEAIEKRRVARVFNDILGGRGAAAHKLDGRTEKRRQRLLKELEAGKARGSRELKPLDVLQRVRSEEHTSELQSHLNLVCRLLLEKKKKRTLDSKQKEHETLKKCAGSILISTR